MANQACNSVKGMGTIMLGHWGGEGGKAWDFNPGVATAIIEIVVSYGDVVDSVTFKSINRVSGKIVSSGRHGGSGGSSVKISIDGTEEYLTSISGTMDNYFGCFVLHSLTFSTNKTTYGPYGSPRGSTFKIPIKNGQIIGFFGRAGKFLDAIGIRVIPSAY